MFLPAYPFTAATEIPISELCNLQLREFFIKSFGSYGRTVITRFPGQCISGPSLVPFFSSQHTPGLEGGARKLIDE